MAKVTLILGDQLNKRISSLRNLDIAADRIFMCEVMEESTYVNHHKKKIALIFSAMRHFYLELKQQGYTIDYVTLNDPANTGSLRSELARYIRQHPVDRLIVTKPGEYRVLKIVQSLKDHIKVSILDDDRFIVSEQEFRTWAYHQSELRMEYFYRRVRKKHNVLMHKGKPEGGQWNFDHDNRKFSRHINVIEQPVQIKPDDITAEVLALVENTFSEHFGELYPFNFATTRKGALKILNHFIRYRLAHFGDYQDAMLKDEPFMFHSLISFYLNIGLLLPKEVVDKVIKAYKKQQIPINAVEGFIRQILGWREFIRGIYWLKMPEYSSCNYFNARRNLPAFFWTADTKLHCMYQCVIQTKKHAYAHHIQRLMILGNFTLLTGIAPKQVQKWYLGVYADAFEWVELPNVNGMILFADGGYLASKPYSAGGSYINKMSDYCKSCHYNVKLKTGPQACPFNYLYWNFLDKHRDKLSDNHRMSMMYSTLNRFSYPQIQAIRESSRTFLKTIHSQNTT